MTPDEQEIAILKSFGYHLCHRCNCGWWFPADDPNCEGSLDKVKRSVPRYLSDLNAMREAVEDIRGNESMEDAYTCYLASAIKGERVYDCDELSHADYFAISQATAAQRAEAFLRAKGLWKEAQ